MDSEITLTYLKMSVVSEISVWCKIYHHVPSLVLQAIFL